MKVSQRLKLMLKSILSLQMGEIKTDKDVLVFDGEEIAVGVEVFTNKPSDEEDIAPAEDGEYVAEDGRIIVVADGKVAEIKEKEEEAEPVIEEAAVEEAVEPAAEPAEEPETEENNVEDRVAALEAAVAEYANAFNEILNAITAFEGRLTEIEDKLVKIEGTPAAEPADEPEVEELKRTRLSYLKKN